VEEFEALVRRHQGELRVHCYRMLGSLDEAEDLVQETFLRAWRSIDRFEGRSSPRAWLYRIATNACLDALDGRSRRALPYDPSLPADVRWLQPFPDRLLEPTQPEAVAVDRETIELAFLAAIQHLPPRQRAALILCDVLGWPAKEAAAALDGSAASVNSALQRARATLRDHLPARRQDWTPSPAPTADERAVLRRYMSAVEHADVAAVAELLAPEVRASMPPYPLWMRGRAAVVEALSESWDPRTPHYVGRFRMIPTGANRQPAAAAYTRRSGDFLPFAITVLRVEDGLIAEMTAFHDAALFPAFGVPMKIPAPDRLNLVDTGSRDGG
jgi:RNA polymerase sigma-70 factor (ECF subfamily)